MNRGDGWHVRTEPRFRRVLMLCFPLSPSSSSLTGLNMKGGGSTGFSIGGSSPYFLKWMRQSVHSKMFSRPPWCQSLESVGGKAIFKVVWQQKREDSTAPLPVVTAGGNVILQHCNATFVYNLTTTKARVRNKGVICEPFLSLCYLYYE